MIVKDPEQPPYQYDEDRLVFLQEYWNQTDGEIISGVLANPLNWPGQPNGWLINGKSISNYNAVNPSTKGLAVIDVEPHKTYRFRFVAATSLSVAIFAFENHTNFKIVQADGSYTKRLNVELFQIGSGQRYDALFETKSCDELRQLGKLDFYVQLETRERDPVVTNYAVLRYSNNCNIARPNRVATDTNPPTAPLTLPPTDPEYLDYQLEPLEDNDFPSSNEVTRRVFLNQKQEITGYFRWVVNNNSWMDRGDVVNHTTTPHKPYLVALYENTEEYLPDLEAAVANGGLDPRTKTYPVRIGEVIEIVFQNIGASSDNELVPPGSLDTHPWHAHGTHIYDIGSGQGAYDPAVAESKLQGTHPVRRDTTVLYKYTDSVEENQVASWRAWRLRVTDPGVWMVHCHTLQHMIQGMQTVWLHGDSADILKVGYPDVTGYLTYGGDVYGNATHAPTVIHFYETI